MFHYKDNNIKSIFAYTDDAKSKTIKKYKKVVDLIQQKQ